MKKFVALAAAAVLLSFNVNAQDISEIVDIYNQGNQEVKNKNYDDALVKITKAYEMALELGDAEGEELAAIKSNSEKLMLGIPYMYGKDLLAEKKYDKAVEKLSAAKLVAEKQGDKDIANEITELLPKIYQAKGTDLIGANDFQNAIEALNKSLSLNPDNAEVHLLIGYSNDKLNNEEACIASNEKAIEVAKATNNEEVAQKASAQLATLYLKKAQVEMQAKKYGDAIAFAKKSNEYNESFNGYYIAGLSAMQAKRADESIANLEKAYAFAGVTDAQQVDLAYYLAVQYDTKGNKAKACANYKKATANPKFKANAEARIKALGC